MKKSTLYWLKVAIPVTALFCTWGGQAAMEVKGFGLSEQDAILDVYGACHRLEEPLVIKFHQRSSFVAFNRGWRYYIKFRFAEEKKYTPVYFAADFDKATGEQGNDVIATGPYTSMGKYNPNTKMHTVNILTNESGGGASNHSITIPSRNIDYLSIQAFSPTNNKGATFVWAKSPTYEPNSNVLTFAANSLKGEEGGWIGYAKNETIDGNLSPWRNNYYGGNGRFNLRSVDVLNFWFTQEMYNEPKWLLDAVRTTFLDRGPFTKAQYEAACQ